ncbi:MAG: undecaprenyl-diphosphate phosphatase [Acetobacter sp.]|nr:undecaprenyl-diphosphate phosphatase [Bacteroides sp.]MCM1341370.1 undecaprenyl-diphosphate phosphatase [Acetobacter sp.]MCM1433462.1 undecaprenyl-diphosphate phosphatase [Clostridiales bacterium]
MSILTAIFQAIGQALAWVFPISESGHSAVFHNFSGRFTNACSQLTGVIHIGIAIGIFIAFFKLFLKLGKSFFTGWNELFHKELNVKKSPAIRKFVYMTIVSFAVLLLYLIPTGHGNLFQILHQLTYNPTLLDEGICFAVTGALLMLAGTKLDDKPKYAPVWLRGLIIGIASLFAIAVGGLSLVAAVFSLGVILGLRRGIAYKYAMVLSVMVLLVAGVTEICIAVTKVSIISAVIALIISAAVSYFSVIIFNTLMKKGALKYFGYYDVSIGAICAVIGIFQLLIK